MLGRSNREETGKARGIGFFLSFSFLKYITKFKGKVTKPHNQHC